MDSRDAVRGARRLGDTAALTAAALIVALDARSRGTLRDALIPALGPAELADLGRGIETRLVQTLTARERAE